MIKLVSSSFRYGVKDGQHCCDFARLARNLFADLQYCMRISLDADEAYAHRQHLTEILRSWVASLAPLLSVVHDRKLQIDKVMMVDDAAYLRR